MRKSQTLNLRVSPEFKRRLSRGSETGEAFAHELYRGDTHEIVARETVKHCG